MKNPFMEIIKVKKSFKNILQVVAFPVLLPYNFENGFKKRKKEHGSKKKRHH